ncbi:MAG: hypothetical protein KAQ94_06055 [Arcobacteraceae bacterium]|nr:hypothetical protein [Arcobacteraceae bacterium]
MKYEDFKKHLTVIVGGDRPLPKDNNDLKTIILQCLREVAAKCEPLSLMTRDMENDILQSMESEDGLYIRVPKLSMENDDVMDMDETLVYAVSYLTASKLSKHKKDDNEDDAKAIMTDYNWKRYKDIESGKLDLQKSVAENSLDIHGYKLIYIKKIKTLNGYVYIWDDAFVTILNKYLAGETLAELSKSDRNNIDEYLAYGDSGLKDNEMYEALNKYLATLGVK